MIPWTFLEKTYSEPKFLDVQSLVELLPEPNKVTLEALMSHLNLVSMYSNENHMDSISLALTFEPIITRLWNF